MAKPTKHALAKQRRRRALKPSTPHATPPASQPDLTAALQLQQAGELEQAKNLYCQILEREPNNSDAWHFLGMIFYAANQHPTALDCLLKANGFRPNHSPQLANLGLIYRGLNDLPSAADALWRAVRLDPDSLTTRTNLGTVLLEQKEYDLAAEQFEFVLTIDSNQENAVMNLGNLRQAQGRFRDAELLYRQVIEINPDNGRVFNNLGEALRNQGQWEAAVTALERGVELGPNSLECRLNLGRTLINLHRLEDAQQVFRTLIAQYPDQAKPYHYLGKACFDRLDMAAAMTNIQRALKIDPQDAHALCSLGFVYLETGQPDHAEVCFRDALTQDPTLSSAHSSLLFVMSGNLEMDQLTLFKEHQRWGQMHGAVQSLGPHLNDRVPNRRLRIGYVSPDLHRHAVAAFFKPVLENHDHAGVETFCYSEVAVPDDMTATLQEMSDHWRDTNGLSDEQVAHQIMSDQIDVLVDLAGHTSKNRLRAFAFRPAPVQVTWIGYPNTTGLDAIDYRLTCEIQNPLDEPSYHSEELLRLKFGSFCYTAPAISPTINSSPIARNGFVTFGSLHRPFKISPPVRELWAKVILANPDSRLLLYNTRFTDESATRLRHDLVNFGVDCERIEIRHQTDNETYLSQYDEIDIGLDVTPWAGGTTTMEALWMGVPVIAIYGERRSARSTAAILNQVGLTDLIARTETEYVRLTHQLAHDIPRLECLRTELRCTLQQTICDAGRFTTSLEQTYRTMWRRWCEAS